MGAGYHQWAYIFKLITGRHLRAIALAVHLTEEAIMCAESTSDSETTQVQTLVRASDVLDHVGEDARVFLACQRALRLAPAHAHASFNAARALRNLGRLPEAEALLERALSHHPNDGDLLRLKAVLLRLGDQNEQSATLLQQLLSRAPENMAMWLNLSFALLHLQRYQEAVEAAEHAIALEVSPEAADAWVNKGRALKALGDDTGAIAAYRQAMRVYSGQLQAHAELAQLYRRHSHPLEAWREQQFVRLIRFVRQAQDRFAAQRRQEELRLLEVSGVDVGE